MPFCPGGGLETRAAPLRGEHAVLVPPSGLSIHIFVHLPLLTTLSHRLVVTVTLQICMRSTHKIVYAQGNPLCPLADRNRESTAAFVLS
jgi:hypothetical protein